MKTKAILNMVGVFLFPILIFAQTWTPEVLPAIPVKWQLRGVHFPSSSQGWAVGYDYDEVGIFKAITKGIVLRYQDGVWTQVNIPNAPENWILMGVWFLEENAGWIFGQDRTEKEGLLIHLQDGKWEKVHLPAINHKDWIIHDLHFLNKEEGWVVGGSGGHDNPILLHYAAGQWTLVESQEFKKQTLLCIHAYDKNTVFAGGHREGDITATGLSRALGSFILEKSAEDWKLAQFPLLSRNIICKDIYSHGPKKAYAIGWMPEFNTVPQSGKMLQYDGKKWSEIKIDPKAKEWNLIAMAFCNKDEGWAVGNFPARNKGLFLEFKKGNWALLGKKSEPVIDGKWRLTGLTYDGKNAYYAVGHNKSSDTGLILKRVK